jgi:hypothetical protein
VAAGRVRVDGGLVDNLDQSAPEPARVVLQAPRACRKLILLVGAMPHARQ